jgi:hypothetical protein
MYMAHICRILLVGLGWFLMLVSCRSQQTEKTETPHAQDSIQTTSVEDTLSKESVDSTSVSQTDTLALLSNEGRVTSSEDSVSLKQVETPAATKPAEPQEETKFYAKGRRRQNWDQMFPLKGNVARVKIKQKLSYNDVKARNYGDYKFNAKGDVISRKWKFAPLDAYERVVGGHREENFYKYNSKGKVIEAVYHSDPHMGWGKRTTITYKYNSKGRLLISKENMTHNDGLFSAMQVIHCERAYATQYDEDSFGTTVYEKGEVPEHLYEPEPITTEIKNGDEKVANLINAGYKNRIIKETIYDADGNATGKVTIKFDSRGNVVKYVSNNDPKAVNDSSSVIYELTIIYR